MFLAEQMTGQANQSNALTMPVERFDFQNRPSDCYFRWCLPHAHCRVRDLPLAAAISFFTAVYPKKCLRLKLVKETFLSPWNTPTNDSSQMGQILFGKADMTSFLWNLDFGRFESDLYPKGFILGSRTDLAIFYDRRNFRKQAKKKLGISYLLLPVFPLLAANVLISQLLVRFLQRIEFRNPQVKRGLILLQSLDRRVKLLLTRVMIIRFFLVKAIAVEALRTPWSLVQLLKEVLFSLQKICDRIICD